ncbi:MAG: response regulator transcription factor [Elusimicrobiota bacterium]
MRYKVLVADDDPDIADSAALWLRKAGHSVVLSYSGEEAMAKVRESQPDLVVMDVLLGDANGAHICRTMRDDPATSHIPVILISSVKTGEADMVSGLSGGADDYLAKPLTPGLLCAKVEAVLRRTKIPEKLGEALKRHGVSLNVAERKVRIGRKEVALTRKEFDLLTVLLRKAGKVVSVRHLLETVWGYETEQYNDPRTVQVHIFRLKKKLGKSFASRIENVVGSGYRLA